MQIAVIADIHGNVPAYDAVMERIDELELDEVLVGGDLVGRGPNGSAICERVRRAGLRSVRGNHEDYLIAFRRKNVDPDWLTSPDWRAARWMAGELSNDDLNYIESLPFSLSAESDARFFVFHGTPNSNNEGLGSWSTDDEVQARLDTVERCDVLALAHTHRPIHWRFGSQLVANVGSVGLPFNGNSNAQFAVFTKSDDGWDVQMEEVEYDVDEAIHEFHRTGFYDEGGAVSFLLVEEIRTARPHLVPFLKWAQYHEHPPSVENAERFLSWYDPSVSLAELITTLKENA